MEEAVFVIPAMWEEDYEEFFIFLGKRLKKDMAEDKLIPPMGRREYFTFFGKKIPKESWKRSTRRELIEETSGKIKPKNIEYVGDIIDKNYEPDTEWHIKIYACVNPRVKAGEEKNVELKGMGWYDVRLIDDLRETNQINETTYKALKMVSNYLKNKSKKPLDD